MRDIRPYILAAIAVFATSCIKDDYTAPDPNLPRRTVLVYLSGDNSLSSTLVSEVEALREGWTYTGNRCLVYIDPVDDVPRLLSLRGGCSTYPVPFIDTVAVYSEENSASAVVLKRVIEDVVERYPADSYGLIFASHGSGWLPDGTLANPRRTIGIDKNTGIGHANAEMELSDFAAAIPDGQFDFILFEACLMSGIEVAYELRGKTAYILASSAELLAPGFTPIYPVSLRYLFNTGQSVENTLTLFAQTYLHYIDTQSGAYRSATLSVIDTKYMEELSAKAGEVFLHPSPRSLDIHFLQHFDRPGSYNDYPASPRFLDFMDYMEVVSTAEEYLELEKLMDKTVIWKAATPTFMAGYNGFEITRHSGLTTYIEQDCFEKLNERYRETTWYKKTRRI